MVVNTVFFLTATYHKPECLWNINGERKMLWDLLDEELCKRNDIIALAERHGVLVYDIASQHKLPEEYGIYPKMRIISSFIKPEMKKEWEEETNDIVLRENMMMDNLFLIGPSPQKSDEMRLVNMNGVIDLLRTIFAKSGKSIMKQLQDFARQDQNEQMHNFMTQLWFLPFGTQNTPIQHVAPLVKKAILANIEGQNYHVVCLYDGCEARNITNFTEYIEREDKVARVNEKKGLIILTGMMCSTGISLPNVDVIFLLNNEKSCDRIFQRMFRCMTPRENKPYGYVVDFNSSRVIHAVLSYADNTDLIQDRETIEHFSIRKRLEQIGMIVDFRSFMDYDHQTDVIDVMVDLWSRDIFAQYDYAREFLALISMPNLSLSDKITWENMMQTAKIGQVLKDKNEKSTKKSLSVNSKEQKMEEDGPTVGAVTKTKERDEKTIRISEILQREIIPYVINFTSIMTVMSSSVDIVNLLIFVMNSSYFTKIFAFHINTIWGVEEKNITIFLQELVKIFTTYSKESPQNYRKITESIEMVKNTFKTMSAKRKDALQFIDSMLKPKVTEKKQYGEVFTPLELVEDMLDKLPSHVWSDPTLKWFDPSVGIGNFMVSIYYRLNEGLKTLIPDKNKRFHHIITKMLYMSEINPRNVHICRLMFKTTDDDCPPINIYEGDSLALDTSKEWGIESFDIVVGNPPFNNSDCTIGTGQALWGKFVEHAITKLVKPQTGMLCMVHPSLWRQYDHRLFRLITGRQILYIEIHGVKDGMRVFQCATRYDFYVLINKPYSHVTKVRDELGEFHKIDLRTWSFLPNYDYSLIKSMIASTIEDRAHVIHDCTYHTQRSHVSREKKNDFVYPIVNSVHQDNTPVLYYTNIKKDNHFTISKNIYRKMGSNFAAGVIHDPHGDFGMTEWAFAIAAPPHQLQSIHKVFQSKYMQRILNAIALRNEVNVQVLKTFVKDFWKKKKQIVTQSKSRD